MRPETIELRPVQQDDIPVLFEHQLDPEGNLMAAVRPRDQADFEALLTGAIEDPDVVPRAIVADGSLVGTISIFRDDGKPSIGYRIERSHWGRGIATAAIRLLLEEVELRPIHARVAVKNIGSLRVLERNGFRIVGHEEMPEEGRYLACTEAKLLLE